MGSVLYKIPIVERREAHELLARRAQQRAEAAHAAEAKLRAQAAAGQLDPARLEKDIFEVHARRMHEDFEDQVQTWIPLMLQHSPESMDELGKYLVSQAQVSPDTAQQLLQRYLDSRMQTFERYVGHLEKGSGKRVDTAADTWPY